MGIRVDLQTDLAEAFDGDLADTVKSFNVLRSTGTYDPATGDNNLVKTRYLTRGIFVDQFEKEDPINQIAPDIKNLIILQNELVITPEIDDLIEFNSREFVIMMVKEDPANSIWMIKCQS